MDTPTRNPGTRRIAASALLSLALGCAAHSSTAASPVRPEPALPDATTHRHDLLRACPQASEEIRDQLAAAIFHEQPVGEMMVHFTLEGRAIGEVRTQGLRTPDYVLTRAAVRRSVKGLTCTSRSPGAHQYTFRLAFVDPDAAAGAPTHRLALLEMESE